ncbi:hypothetical protein L204_106031 [Cryptococcus depauperatus]
MAGWMDGMRCGGYREPVCREEACGGSAGEGSGEKAGGVGGGGSRDSHPPPPLPRLTRMAVIMRQGGVSRGGGVWVGGYIGVHSVGIVQVIECIECCLVCQVHRVNQCLVSVSSIGTSISTSIYQYQYIHHRTHNATGAHRKNHARTETTQRLHLLRRTHLQAETGRRKDPRVGRGRLVVWQLRQGRQPALEAGESAGETGLGRGGQEEGAGASEGGRRRSSVVQCPPSPVSVGGEAVGPARDGAGGETPPSPPLSPYGAFPVALQQPSWPVGPAGDSVHTPHSYLPPGLFSPTWSLENAAFDMALQDASLFTALWPGVNLFQPYAYGPDVAAGYPVDAYNTLGC